MDPSKTSDLPRFLSDEQRAVVAAMMARIIPSDDGPGAAEAGTIDFLERYLSGVDFIYAKPDGSGFESLTGRRRAAWTQRVEAVRRKYVEGIREVERVSEARFGRGFAGLSEADQDEVLRQLERNGTGGATAAGDAGDDLSGASIEIELQMSRQDEEFDFFPLVITHTRQGFYSDPIYGGNRDHVGWKTIGFPGPASMAEVHSGAFSTLAYFAADHDHPGEETSAR
jgi:gluconate 2-dehydrogenase gamma chain